MDRGGVLAAIWAASPNPSSKPVDVTPAANLGRVIRPQGVAVPEPVTGNVIWRTNNTIAPQAEMPTITGRKYGFIVDRTTQIWWPTRSHQPERGYDGRWGPDVTHDPKFRRSGMRTPQCWLMFFVALALKQ